MTTPQHSTLELADRLGALARVSQVVASSPISTTLQEVVLSGAAELAGQPGNDVMVLVGEEPEHVLRRRYSVRSVDTEANCFSIWVAAAPDGPGSAWARSAQAGDDVDIVGPRGKILLDPVSDWHLFMGDVTALAASYRMAQSIEPPGRAIFIIETENPDDAVTAQFEEGIGVTGIFVDRRERALNDPAGLLSGLAAFAFPPGNGHAYLFGEFSVIKVLREALLDRGLAGEDISRKAHWRMGRPNAAHGEPDKNED